MLQYIILDIEYIQTTKHYYWWKAPLVTQHTACCVWRFYRYSVTRTRYICTCSPSTSASRCHLSSAVVVVAVEPNLDANFTSVITHWQAIIPWILQINWGGRSTSGNTNYKWDTSYRVANSSWGRLLTRRRKVFYFLLLKFHRKSLRRILYRRPRRAASYLVLNSTKRYRLQQYKIPIHLTVGAISCILRGARTHQSFAKNEIHCNPTVYTFKLCTTSI